ENIGSNVDIIYYVCEEFIPSKPIYSGKDNTFHDGCMRYILLVEESKDDSLKLYHFGGYWRLCPEPLRNYTSIDAMRANLCKGAIPQKVSKNDLNFIRTNLEKIVPIFYRNILSYIRSPLHS
ncbi:MAG: hypothetical protein AABY14_02305, partial [Nanoarchaeota archaeon]